MHATVAHKDFDPVKKDEIQKCVADLAATPVDCGFRNVTIMAKVGPPQAYAGMALPVLFFEFAV